MAKNLSSNYGKKPLDTTEILATEALKVPSKRAIQTTVEATGDLVGNKIVEKITKTK